MTNALLALLLGVLLQPEKIDRRARLWIEVENPVVEEGEMMLAHVWLEITPGIGTMLPIKGTGLVGPVYAPGNAGMWISVKTNADGWFAVKTENNLCHTFPSVVDNSFHVAVFNYLEPLGCYFPVQKNPIELLTFGWTLVDIDVEQEVEVDFEYVLPFSPPFAGAVFKYPKPPPPYMPENWNVTAEGTKVVLKPIDCWADCNDDGGLSIDDFICFQTLYATNAYSLADCNKDQSLTIDDFICFQTAYAIGC